MNILYIVMGGIDALHYYMEAYLSIRSFQKQLSADDQIFVITDNAAFFKRAGVKIIPITAEEKASWMGPHKFFFRTKIKGIDYLLSQHPDQPILYLDSDTFLYGDIAILRQRLQEGKALMHVCEGMPDGISNTARRLWGKVNGRTYAGITIGENHQMWNAGVIGLPPSKAQETISTALTICDGMLDDGANTFITEQYANSIALQEQLTLSEASDVIGHYWSNKEDWEQLAQRIFIRAYMSDLPLEEELEALDIEELKRTPIFVHHSHRGEQLHALIDRWFPDKHHRCVGV